ncbi:MAG TPA: YbjN domain-containing protein [Candidatus Avipropionibacterium avicola]|uniref:YbjN domain-containing protein n=1 Tax=Candidatus Avipropionibacterium avicola TaxID=2840701 RepID=A0A9D1GZB5_9ACTN|nr:YbjN domain-containing protein [Candidatus Avipropionibacterium avicola]
MSGDEVVTPLTWDRVAIILQGEDYAYEVDDDGDIWGAWQYGTMHFLLRGMSDEILCVQGMWHGELAEDDYAIAQDMCNTWNCDERWPKTYVETDDDGAVLVRTEDTVNYAHGATTDQLRLHINGSLDAAEEFFGRLNLAFPETWERFRPDQQ